MTNQTGLLVIISSPSGGGKDTIINALLRIIPRSVRFITTTSRPPRPGQIDGIDYHFVSSDDFKNKIAHNELAEYNFYANNYYGTEKSLLEQSLQNYSVIFTQIDVNGKHHFDQAGISHLSIFLLPENLEVIKNRIEKRGGISPELIEERLKIAEKEIAESKDYDYRIVNVQGKLDETIKQIAAIINGRLADNA